MSKRGKLIVLESIEGAGKGTATDYMREYFRKRDLPVKFTRELGGTPYAEVLRGIHIDEANNFPNTPVISDLLIAYAARIDHTKNFIIPALEAGYHVFSERYYASTFAYQGVDCPIETQAIHNILRPHLVQPDLTVLLDISAETSYRRLQIGRVDKGIPLDKYEVKPKEYFERVRAAYHECLDSSWCVIDAEKSIPEVKAALCSVLNETLGIT